MVVQQEKITFCIHIKRFWLWENIHLSAVLLWNPMLVSRMDRSMTHYITDGSVRTVTRIMAGGQGFNCCQLRGFSSPLRPGWLYSIPHLISIGYWGLSSRANRTGAWSHLTSTQSGGKHMWSHASTSPKSSWYQCVTSADFFIGN